MTDASVFRARNLLDRLGGEWTGSSVEGAMTDDCGIATL
jgi:hypothetical protein